MRRVFKAVLTAIWFMALTLPVMGIKLNTLENSVTWRFDRILWLGAGVFVLAVIWDWCFSRKAKGLPLVALPEGLGAGLHLLAGRPRLKAGGLVVLALFMLVMPLVSSFYQTNIMISALLYVMLALGLNIVVGLAGQLVLGYVAFYAVGAYAYGLLYQFFGWGFWACLPVGGVMAVLFGLALGFPVLRLRGDYLAIATLGFAEIIRIIFLNTQTLTNGSMGVKSIPPTANLLWCFGVAALMVVFMLRLIHSSYGRAFKAIRDDEIAAEAMGINLFKHKMYSFILSAFIAGVGGGLMASVVSAITPNLFRFTLAYDILLIVVLGGMGSITGTVVAAFVITAAKEWLRWLDAGFSIGPLTVPEIPGLRMVIFSVLLMGIILFYRQGFFGSKEFSWRGLFAFVHGLPRRLRRLVSRDKKEAA